jgi:sugar phosphate permease
MRRLPRHLHAAATSFLALFSIVGLALYGLPLFYDHMVREFGWSRTQVTSGNAISKLVVGPLLGFAAGWFIDRFGPRRFMLAGILLTGAALWGLGSMTALWMFYAFYLLNALGYVCGGPLPNQVLLSRWFRERRGTAMGVAYLGIGLGGAAVPWLVYWMTEAWGWRGALRGLGALVVVLAWPMAYLTKEAPAESGPAARGHGAAAFRAVLRRPAFYLLAAGSMCSIAAVGGANQHLKLFLGLDRGYSQGEAARVISLALTCSIAGRIVMGWLADRMSKKRVMLIIYLLVASSIPLLFFASSRTVIYLFAAMFGIGLGGEYLIIPLIAAELFGVAVLGRVMGIVVTADGVSEAVSPMVVGYLRDATGSYGAGFIALVAIALAGAAAIALLPTRSTTMTDLHRLASCFRLPHPIEVHDFPDKGNINQQTFVVRAGTRPPREYLLQRINDRVFTRPRSVMRAMIASIEAQRASIADGRLVPGDEWEPITLVDTCGGQPYLDVEDDRGASCWRLMVRILESRTYKSLGEIADPAERLRIAAEAGRGLAIYGDLTCRMATDGLENPLPGYRDTRLYFNQLRSVLAGHRTSADAAGLLPSDPSVRHSAGEHFLVHLEEPEYRRRANDSAIRTWVDLVRAEEAYGMTLLEGMESGRLRRVAIHGDTKLDNFLFSTRTGRVKALVDLDTIMPHTWLADWGDMVRSLVNVAGEKERDLSRVRVDLDVYRAVARGFLSTAREVTPSEVDLMADAPQIIALELGLRFLTDYVRGDSYFKLGPADPPDLNRARATAQLTLFLRFRECRKEMSRVNEDLRAEFLAKGVA